MPGGVAVALGQLCRALPCRSAGRAGLPLLSCNQRSPNERRPSEERLPLYPPASLAGVLKVR